MAMRKSSFLLLFRLMFGLVGIFLVSLCVGRYSIPLAECLNILTNGLLGTSVTDSTSINVILYLRLPRILAAILIGSSLSLSGLVYQSVFQNMLISPDILGVSSGACVGAATGIILGASSSFVTGMAFIGGIISVCISLIIPNMIHNKSNLSLVLSGIIVSSFMNSMIGILKYISDPNRKLAEITFWMMGSIAGIKYQDIVIILPIVVICSAFIWLLRWRINILSLGEENVAALGVNFKITRLVIIICCTLLTACSVSISGSVGWIGLVVPHMARFISDADHRKSIPVTMLMGAIFMTAVDLVARSASRNEIPLSIITGFTGTPLYIFLLAKRRVIH